MVIVVSLNFTQEFLEPWRQFGRKREIGQRGDDQCGQAKTAPPDRAVFVNDRIVVVIGDQITAIDLENGRACQTDELAGMPGSIAVSPDQTHIAVGTNGGVTVFNVVRGKTVGRLAVPGVVLRGEKGENPQMMANRLCRPRHGFFTLPFGDRMVLLSRNDAVFGTTRLTIDGPVEE